MKAELCDYVPKMSAEQTGRNEGEHQRLHDLEPAGQRRAAFGSDEWLLVPQAYTADG